MCSPPELTELQLCRHRRDRWAAERELARGRLRALRECLDRWIAWRRGKTDDEGV